MHTSYSRNITPMPPTKINIFKWIFILLFTRTCGFMVLKISNVNEKQLMAGVLKVIQNKNTNPERAILNNIVVRGPKDRRSLDYLKEFKNKIIVKRILPHGYKVSNYEYDEKFQSLYKPLVRIHKVTPTDTLHKKGKSENRYDVMVILDEDRQENIHNIRSKIAITEPFATNNKNKQSANNKPKIEEYTGNEGENVVKDFMSSTQEAPFEYDYEDESNESSGVHVLSFGPMGLLKAKQLRKVKRPKYEKPKTLRHVDSFGDRDKQKYAQGTINWNNIYPQDPRPQKLYKENKTDENFIDHILGILTQKTPADNDIPIRNELTAKITDSLEKNRDNGHHAYEYPYRVGKSGFHVMDINRDGIDKQNTLFGWFGPVGHMVGKHTTRQKLKRTKRDPVNRMEGKLFSSIAAYNTLKRKVKQDSYNKDMDVELRTFYKSNEEPDPLTPVKPYFDFEENAETTEKPKWLPEYSYWNYWTYDKPLYQDACKGDLVNIGGVCAALPPY